MQQCTTFDVRLVHNVKNHSINERGFRNFITVSGCANKKN